MKRADDPADRRAVRAATLPVSTWNYKTQPDSVRHMGPVAQDFRAAIGLGEDDKHISTLDAEGVALAAIQALYQTMTEQNHEIAELRACLAHLEQQRIPPPSVLSCCDHWGRPYGSRDAVRHTGP